MSYSPTSPDSDISDYPDPVVVPPVPSSFVTIAIPPPPTVSHSQATFYGPHLPPLPPGGLGISAGDNGSLGTAIEMELELMREAVGRVRRNRPDPAKDLYNDTRPFDISKLPLELQEEILGYLDITTNTKILARLCLVSKTFNSRYTPRLYSNLDLIRQNGFRAENKLLSDVICTLASKGNDNAALVNGIRIFDDLRNSFSKVDGGTIAVIFSMFHKNQLKEICVDVGATSLSDVTGAFKNKSAANILINQNAVERVEWSLANNLMEGICEDDFARTLLLKDIAATQRTSLTSLNVFNFVDPDSVHGLRAYLKSAVNLREFGFGFSSSKCDMLYEDEDMDGVFDDLSESEDGESGEDNNDQTNEDGYFNPGGPPYIDPPDADPWDLDHVLMDEDIFSVTQQLFKYINRRCDFAGHLTSLKLEKVPLKRKSATAGLVASTFRMDALQKLVLLDCIGLPSFLEKLSPPDMKSLATLHLEFRKPWSEAVEMFLDNLPTGTLTDLALLQWGGGLTLPTVAGSWPDVQAAHLVSLVLDARPDMPPSDEEPAGCPYEPAGRKQETSIPIDGSNDPFFLRELFTRMVNLKELGISCSIDTLTAATHKSPFLPESRIRPRHHHAAHPHHYGLNHHSMAGQNDGPAEGESSRTAPSRRDRDNNNNQPAASKSPFLSWLSRFSFGGGTTLPRLRVFQMRNLRTWDDILTSPTRFHIDWTGGASTAINRIQADVEHIHSSVLPQASTFIIGCKHPTQYYHATEPVEGIVSGRKAFAAFQQERMMLSGHEMADELHTVIAKRERQAWLEANFPALYIACKGVRLSRPFDIAGHSTKTVCKVLPTMDHFMWNDQYIRVGSGHVKEEFLLPRSWKELDSKVYEVAWSR